MFESAVKWENDCKKEIRQRGIIKGRVICNVYQKPIDGNSKQ